MPDHRAMPDHLDPYIIYIYIYIYIVRQCPTIFNRGRAMLDFKFDQ